MKRVYFMLLSLTVLFSFASFSFAGDCPVGYNSKMYINVFEPSYPIDINTTMCITFDLNTYTPQFSAPDYNDSRIYSNIDGVQTQLDRVIYPADSLVVLCFQSPISIATDQNFIGNDTNNFSFCTNNAGAGAGLLDNWQNVYNGDEWEDGEWTANPTWINNATGARSMETTVIHRKHYSVKSINSVGGGSLRTYAVKDVNTIGGWVSSSTIGGRPAIFALTAANGYIGGVEIGVGNNIQYYDNAYHDYVPALAATANKWYWIEIQQDYDGHLLTRVYDSNRATLLRSSSSNTGNSGIGQVRLVHATNDAIYWDETGWYNSTDANVVLVAIGGGGGSVTSNFDYDLNPSGLDPENSINDLNINLTDTSTTSDVNIVVQDGNYLRGAVLLSNSLDYNYNVTNVGDYNITHCVRAKHIVTDVNYYNCTTQLISVYKYPQDLNIIVINPSANYVGSTIDLNAYADTNGSVATWGWTVDGQYYTDQNISHTWLTSGIKNIDMNVTTNGLTKSFDINFGVYGYLNMNFYDENSGIAITPTTLTINGADYTGSLVGNNLNLGLSGFTTNTYTIIASDVNHTARTWQYDLNAYSQIDVNAALLQTDLNNATPLSIDFVFYEPDETTICSECYITALTQDINAASRIKTSADGEATFFLNTADSNYSFIVETDTNTFTYYQTHVTVNIPKDEDSLANVSPFDIDVGGLAVQQYTNLTASQQFFILSNTVDYYTVEVDDTNTNYYPRSYAIKTIGDTATYTLQPYLISIALGDRVTEYVVDNFTTETMENVLIVAYRNLTGLGLTIVESRLTDGAGIATFSFLAFKNYLLKYYYGGSYIGEKTLNITQTEYYTRLKTDDTIDMNPSYTTSQVLIIFTPESNTYLDSNSFTIVMDVTALQGTIDQIDISVSQAGTTLYAANDVVGVTYGKIYTIDFNESTIYNYSPLTAQVCVTTSEGYYCENQTWLIKRTSVSSGGLVESAGRVKSEMLGPFGSQIAALFVILIILFSVYGLGVRDVNILGPLFVFLVGIFTFVFNWVPLFAFVIVLAMSGAYFLRGVNDV